MLFVLASYFWYQSLPFFSKIIFLMWMLLIISSTPQLRWFRTSFSSTGFEQTTVVTFKQLICNWNVILMQAQLPKPQPWCKNWNIFLGVTGYAAKLDFSGEIPGTVGFRFCKNYQQLWFPADIPTFEDLFFRSSIVFFLCIRTCSVEEFKKRL